MAEMAEMAERTGSKRRNGGTETNGVFSVFVSVSPFLRFSNPLPPSSPSARNGFTFVELVVVTTILLILASAVMPLAKVTVQRQREMELHRVLREMRTAIDKYKDAVDNGLIGSVDVKAGSEGYPPDLETLVEGVSVANDASGRKLKFLRRVPMDPITNSKEWGLRSYTDKPDSTSWGGGNVYDVYSKSPGTALDGTKYRDW